MPQAPTLSLKGVIESQPENKKCIDCGMARPQWASITCGVFLCLNCAGIHRSFGVKVSIVKSVGMDIWSAPEIKKMELGGNKRFQAFLEQYSLERLPKQQLYAEKRVREYAQALQREVHEVFPEEKPAHSPRERPKRSTPSPATVEVSKQPPTLSSSYTSIYSQPSSYPAMETLQTGLTDILGKAAGYLYTASSSISEQFTGRILTPATAIIKEKHTQLAEYMMKPKEKKDQNRHSKSQPKSMPSKESPPQKQSMDKWD